MKKSITVGLVSTEIESNFDRFTFRLEKALGILKPSAIKALGAAPASMSRYLYSTEVENELVLFNIFSNEDLSYNGKGGKIKHYQVGNREIMLRMMAKHETAGLYFPIRLLVYEKPDGNVVIEYILPSSLFEQFNDGEILADSLILENNLIKIIREADKEDREDQ